MNRAEILHAAERCVTVDRAATHGDAEQSFTVLGALWSARLGVLVHPHQVAIMLADLKTVRAWNNPGHTDNWIDLAGYAACGGEIATGATLPDPFPQPRDSSGDDPLRAGPARNMTR